MTCMGGSRGYAHQIAVRQVALFDMPNSYQFDILSISIFSEISLSISIFSKISLSIFSKKKEEERQGGCEGGEGGGEWPWKGSSI